MIEDQLRELKKHKKTSDLFTEPLILLTNNKTETIEEIENKLIMQTEFSNKHIDRLSLTEKEEKNFERKMSKYLRNLMHKMETEGIEDLIDFHIKFHFIDRMNKNDLLFLIMPFEKYSEQICELMSMKDFSISFLAKQLNNFEFLELFVDYFDFSELFFVRNFIEKVLLCFLRQHQWLKEKLAEFLILNLERIKTECLFNSIYSVLTEKTDFRIEGVEIFEIKEKEEFERKEIKEISEDINKENIESKEELNIYDDFKNLREENHKEFLRFCSEKFLIKNKMEISKELLKYKKPDLKRIADFLTEKDLQKIKKEITNKKNILESSNLLELIFLNSEDLFSKIYTNFNSDIHEKENNWLLVEFILNNELFQYENILLKNLEIIYEKLKEKENLNFLLYEFADSLICIEKYNEIIRKMYEMGKLPVLNLEKLSNENKKHFLKEPENEQKFFEENLKEIVERLRNKPKRAFLIKNELDLINLEGIEHKLMEFLINKLEDKQNKNKKYFLSFILEEPLNAYLLDFINRNSIQLIIEQLCLEKNDFTFYYLIIDNLLDNKENLKKNYCYLEKIVKQTKGDLKIKNIFEENIEKFLDENGDLNLNMKILQICLEMNISLLPVLRKIFKILEREMNTEFLNGLIFKYKKILSPFLNFICKNTDKRNLLVFDNLEVLENLEFLDKKKFVDFLKITNLDEEVFLHLKKKMNSEILFSLFENENISKILKESSIEKYFQEFVSNLKENELFDFIYKTIKQSNVHFFGVFINNLLDKFMQIEIAELCLQKFLEFDNSCEIEHEIHLNELINQSKLKEKTISLFLRHKNSKDFSYNFNQNILKKFKNEERKLLKLFENIYENYADYKVCLESSMPFFINLLETQDDELRKETENLLEKIEAYTKTDIQKYL